ncbi:hypothetical protein JMUB6875_16720 [Nocardia sp. JMUB6875]
MLRAAAALTVSRFDRLTGIPERTSRRRLARLRDGDPPRGPWPSPKVERFEPIAAKYAQEWSAWGHRKIAALMRADGYEVSTSTVEWASRRRGLLLPRGLPSGPVRSAPCAPTVCWVHCFRRGRSGGWWMPERPRSSGQLVRVTAGGFQVPSMIA